MRASQHHSPRNLLQCFRLIKVSLYLVVHGVEPSFLSLSGKPKRQKDSVYLRLSVNSFRVSVSCIGMGMRRGGCHLHMSHSRSDCPAEVKGLLAWHVKQF